MFECEEPDPIATNMQWDMLNDGIGVWQTTPTYNMDACYLDACSNGTYIMTLEGTAEFCNYQEGQVVGYPPMIDVTGIDSANTTGPDYQDMSIFPVPGYIWPTEYVPGPFDYKLQYFIDPCYLWKEEIEPSIISGAFPATVTLMRINPILFEKFRFGTDELAIDFGPQYPVPTIQTAQAKWSLEQANHSVIDTSPVMQTDAELNVGDIVTVNETGGCFEIVLNATQKYGNTGLLPVDYTYDQNGGVYATCADCTGGGPQQNCHYIAATTTPTVFAYNNDFEGSTFITLNAGQSDTICATVNSVIIQTGTGSFTDLGTQCFETDYGSSCDVPPVPTKECYTFEGVAGPGTEFSKFEWFEDNVAHSVKLKPGETYTACADQGTPQNTYGDGNIVESGDLCTDITDCVICYNYLYEGPNFMDLFYIDCDGNRGYIRDVAFLIGSNIGTIPVCISKITGGSAERFITQTTTCT